MMLRDAHSVLLRAVRRTIREDETLAMLCVDDREFPILTIEAFESESWASTMFSGQRHRLGLRLEGASGELGLMSERLTMRLHEVDIELPGHVLIDMALVKAETCATGHAGAQTCRMTFEALTVED